MALVLQLCLASNVQGSDYYDGGMTYDVTTTSSYSIWIDGEGTIVNFKATIPGGIYMCWFSPGPTLNFGADAYSSHIDAGPDSCVNLNGGSVGFAVFVSATANVTVAGDRFEVGGTTYGPGTTIAVNNAMVKAYDEWGKQLFSGSIMCSAGATITLGAEAGDLEVQIDVKPGDSDPAVINLRSSGLVPVAVLSDGNFDATSVSPSTVQFAGARVATSGSGKYMAHVEDVDKDGDDDMLLHFRTGDLKLADGIVEAVVELTGQLASPAAGPSVRSLSLQSADRIDDGTPISGTEKVYILGSKKK